MLIDRQQLLCGLVPLLVTYISEAIGGIFLLYWVLYRNCDTIIRFIGSTVNNLQKLKVSCMGCFDKSSRCN
ncbi:hypothetical protein [Microcoleus asticus]|uniref:hypothetical protein n=1 Tax=Microcoleus asticus TaxID=2815231 RepID=UPI001C130FD0|nr:hypothetical protein [Microcoleus asticus]